jgi:hypothetical protein
MVGSPLEIARGIALASTLLSLLLFLKSPNIEGDGVKALAASSPRSDEKFVLLMLLILQLSRSSYQMVPRSRCKLSVSSTK